MAAEKKQNRQHKNKTNTTKPTQSQRLQDKTTKSKWSKRLKKSRNTDSQIGAKPGSDPRLLIKILGGDGVECDLNQMNTNALAFLSKSRLRSRSQFNIGKTRVKLAKIVSECLGIICNPEDLQPAKGANRTNKSLDIYAWEVFATHQNGVPFVAGCFETMTQCVKAGAVYLHKGEIYSGLKHL